LCTDYSAKDLVKVVKAGAIIVDEAGLVAIDRMAMLFSSLRENDGKLLVIGDDKQLPPVSIDFVADSLFRSILQQYQTTLLKTEYRFNEDILDLINPHYDYKSKADRSIKDISTSDIAKKDYNGINNNLTKILDHDKKIVFVDTNGVSQEQRTYINTGEISIVTQIIDGFMNMGIDDIIVTTPYKQQERLFQLNLIKKTDYINTKLITIYVSLTGFTFDSTSSPSSYEKSRPKRAFEALLVVVVVVVLLISSCSRPTDVVVAVVLLPVVVADTRCINYCQCEDCRCCYRCCMKSIA